MSRSRRRRTDSGFTLIEVVIAMSLSVTIIGVLVAVLITTMNVASSTTALAKDSTDLSLVTAFLYKDAQAAGGTDPNTALANGLGVSTSDAGGCIPSGSMRIRFSWLDHPTPSTSSSYVVTYALNTDKTFNRRLCKDGATVADVTLGRNVTSVTASCDTGASCTGTPTTVSLTLVAAGTLSPLQTTLSASLRPRSQTAPSTSNSSTISFLALGDLATGVACPVVTGTGAGTFMGNAIVSSACGSNSVANLVVLSPGDGGTLAKPYSQVNDPLASLKAPAAAASCPVSGTATALTGALTAGTTDGPATLSATTTMGAGVYVFCNGLTITGTAALSGTSVTIYVAKGGLTVASGAAIDLTADTSTGAAYPNVVAWVAAGSVGLTAGPAVQAYRGLLYAPSSAISLDAGGTSFAINLGALIARSMTFNNPGAVRFGTVPSLSLSPSTLPDGVLGTAYSQPLTVSGGAVSPLAWKQIGLPKNGFTFDAVTGTVGGTPTCSGITPVVVAAIDNTNAAASQSYSINVPATAGVDDPGSNVRSTVHLTATVGGTCGGSAKVTFMISAANANSFTPITGPACAAGQTTAPFTCDWVTTANAAANWDLEVKVDDGTTVTYSAPIKDVLADNVAPSTLSTTVTTNKGTVSGLMTITSTAIDGDTGIDHVLYEYAPTGTSSWATLCATGTLVAIDTYQCQSDSSLLANATYDIRTTAFDQAFCASASICPVTGNSKSVTTNSVKVDNTIASLSMYSLPIYVSGTVNLRAEALPAPATVVFAYQLSGTATWTNITCTQTVAGNTYTCPWTSTAVNDGAITFRATMGALTATTTSYVDNSPVRGYDVQTVNGGTAGRIDTGDKIVFTYNTTMSTSSILSGWNGSSTALYVRVRDGKQLNPSVGPKHDALDFSRTSTFPNLNVTSTSTGLGSIGMNWDFIGTSSKQAQFNATVTAATVSGRTVVTVTIGGQITSVSMLVSGHKKAAIWIPSATATDTNTKVCSIAPVTETGTNDIDF